MNPESGIATIGPEWFRAGGIFATFLVIALAVNLLWSRIVARWMQRTSTTFDDVIFSVLRNLVVWAVVFAGIHSAFQEVSAAQKNTVVWTLIGKALTVGWLILVVLMAIEVLNVFFRWRIESAMLHEPGHHKDTVTRIGFVRKLLNAITILLGGLYILSVAGIDISPVIAGGALSGIVIGIALQDTLSNIFAGFFLNFDRPIKIGDFIRIENSQEGYVEEVGWRYSRIRLIGNNLLIVPNNKLSQSLITNYSLASHRLSVAVPCTVSYDNDLQKVEDIAIKTAADLEYGGEKEPQVRFKEFGPDSISLVVVLRSEETTSQNRLQHEFIKALHEAFKVEGIKVPK